MPNLATPLTDIQVKKAKPKDKPYIMADDDGMYLEYRDRLQNLAHGVPPAQSQEHPPDLRPPPRQMAHQQARHMADKMM
jgi:hypothetical protein